MRFAPRQVQSQLSQRSQIGIKKQPRSLPDCHPKHTSSKFDAGQAVEVIEQARRKKRVELAQENNLPSFPLHGRLQRAERFIPEQLPPEPLPAYPSADEK